MAINEYGLFRFKVDFLFIIPQILLSIVIRLYYFDKISMENVGDSVVLYLLTMFARVCLYLTVGCRN